MPIKVFAPGLKYYVDRIKSGNPYSFTRFGDGAWSSVMGDRVRTSSGSQRLNIPSLKKAMALSLMNCHEADNYIVGMRPGSERAGIQRWLRRNAPDIKWHDCRVFYLASRKGRLYLFIKALRELEIPIVIVGPKRLRQLDGGVIKVGGFVQVRNKNCWQDKTRIIANCLAIKGPAFFTFSAGPATKPIIWELYKHIGNESFLIDLGSLWDRYVGVFTRRYHRSITGAVVRRNLRGK